MSSLLSILFSPTKNKIKVFIYIYLTKVDELEFVIEDQNYFMLEEINKIKDNFNTFRILSQVILSFFALDIF